MSKVIILGGGMSGLTAAHELVTRGFEVEVYERNSILGGKARSTRHPQKNTDNGIFLPAEHGFRFFPAFYSHVTDTMRRIPLPGGRAVFDNLVAAKSIAFAQEADEPIMFPANKPSTLREWIEALNMMLSNPGFGVASGERSFFINRIICILCSCQRRRETEYENTSWWEFIDAENMSENYRKYFARGLTRSLVAMRSEVGSTLTVGNILIQLLLDIMDSDRDADRVLNGPTNEVWIEPWESFLHEQGVKIHRNAEVKKFSIENGRLASVTVAQDGAENEIMGDYYIAALPVEILRSLLSEEQKIEAGLMSQDGAIGIDHLKTAWMNGILFYLNREVSMAHGHVIYADSPWALTSITQQQFWSEKIKDKYGDGKVVDILSGIVSEWEEEGDQEHLKKAMQCSKQEIFKEAWAQIKIHRQAAETGALEDAHLVDWYLDEAVEFKDDKPEKNREELLINTVGSRKHRPRANSRIHNLFVAGDFIRTHSDLATMESANEAGRRAVNHILEAEASKELDCAVNPLEEPSFLKPFKLIDDIRFAQGKPSLVCEALDSRRAISGPKEVASVLENMVK